MDKSKADFSGWATRNDLECSDGRTIRHNAFKECDGKTVPLVWNHQHNTPDNILGHALLENRSDGVYAYCFFNETESAKAARLLVKHGDIVALSIFANQLKQQGGNVLHGTIREVSLVPAGANPGAFIDYVMAHGDDGDEAIILSPGEPLSLSHSDGGAEKAGDKKEDKPSEKDGDKPSEEEDDGETIEDVVNSMTEKQKKVMYALVGAALSSDGEKPEDKEKDNDDSEGGDKTMKHNVFEGEDTRDIKGDIRKCFPSTDHEKLKAAVFPRLGDERFRKLLGQYIDQVDGLALGHQTSHICAVYYMSKVLHYINQDLGCSLSGMYMDDWYVIVETKEEAKVVLEAARKKFALLGYELNEKTEIYPLRHGIDFCGFRVYITRTGKVIRKLRTSSKKRIKRRIKKWDRDYAEGLVSKDEIEVSFQSSCAHIKHGDTEDLIADLRSRVDRIYEKHQNKEEDPSEQENQHAFVRSPRKAQRKRCRQKVHLPGV